MAGWARRTWFPVSSGFFKTSFFSQKCQAAGGEVEKKQNSYKVCKDVLRASGLPLLPEANLHVKQNLKKVKKVKKLSPVSLVSGEPLIIVDGYHRISAIYYLSKDLEIPCRLINREGL